LAEADQHRGFRQPAVSRNPLLDEAVELLKAPNFIPVWALERELAGIQPGDREWTLHYLSTPGLYGYLTLAHDQPSKPQSLERSADYALAQVRLDTMFFRGGTTGHGRMAASHHGQRWLAEHADRLSLDKAREIVQVLERSLAERDDPALLRQRARIYGKRSDGWTSRLRAILAPQPLANKFMLERSHDLVDATLPLRGLQVLYAVRLFRHEHGPLPAELDELTPRYLPSVPLDPYSGRPLIYRRLENGYSLYSVGRDGLDDGGTFITRVTTAQPTFDLDLSWSNRPRK
jgi:hypothetical protein